MNSNHKKPTARILTITGLIFTGILAISSLSHAEQVTYSYDDLNRLIKSDYGNGNVIDYTYDAAGNRTSQTITTRDTDGDGIPDQSDNCTLVANANQADTDQDNYGNACDADLNNNKIVNALDLGLFKKCYLKQAPDAQCAHPEHADFNNDSKVNSLDLGLFKKMYLKPPGPSGRVNSNN